MAWANWREWNWKRGAALLLSALAHVLVVLLLLGNLIHPSELPVPPTITVELVPEPVKPKPKPEPVKPPEPEPAKPEPPKPPKPEPPKPDAPKPDPAKPEPPKPEPAKPQAAAPKPPPPPPPQPQAAKPPPPPRPWYLPDKVEQGPGKLAEKSHGLAMGIGIANPDLDPTDAGEATLSERDLILGQILPLWQRSAIEGVITLRVLVLADGSLGPPFSAKAPWNPARAINHYNEAAPGNPVMMSLIGLYTAIRLAQPLKLPPALKAKAPFYAVLDFQPGGLR